MSETVGFTRMTDGTAADYALLDRLEAEELRHFPDRVLGWLRTLDDSAGYRITRLEHSLQAATRAHRAGENEETVVCALLHDIGDHLAPANHSEVAAAMLRPYVSERNYWVLKHHGVFQGKYYYHHLGLDPDERDQWRQHPHYQATVDFCANYDEVSFDPDYAWEPLEFFEPLVRRVLAPPAPGPDPTTCAVTTPTTVGAVRTTVGFVGVGNLGRLLAGSLLRAGYPVTLTDLDPDSARDLLDAGATWAATAREAAADVDCVITCLPTPRAVEHCLTSDDGVLAGLRAGATWIDMSTNDAEAVRRLSALAAERGVRTLECPVTGGVHTAEVGTITALVGGDVECLEEHRTLLEAMTDPVIHVGELGQASTLKVVTNMLAFVNQWAAGEALMLARMAGIDLGRAYEGIRHSSGNSWSMEIETQLVLSGSYDFRFSLDLACKDLDLAHQLGRTHGVPLEIAGHVEQIFRRAHAEYGGDATSTRVVQLLEDTMGESLRAEGFPASLFGRAPSQA